MCFSGFLVFFSIARSTRLCSACRYIYLISIDRSLRRLQHQCGTLYLWWLFCSMIYLLVVCLCVLIILASSVFLLCALWFHDISTCQSSYLSSLLISVRKREEPSFKKCFLKTWICSAFSEIAHWQNLFFYLVWKHRELWLCQCEVNLTHFVSKTKSQNQLLKKCIKSENTSDIRTLNKHKILIG